MDFLNTVVSMIQNLLQSLNADGEFLLPLVLIFIAVFLGAIGLFMMLAPRDRTERRLAGEEDKSGGSRKKDGRPRPENLSLRSKHRDSKWDQIVKPIEKHILPGDKQESQVAMKLRQAGFISKGAVRNFYLVRTFLAIAAPGTFLLFSPYFGEMPVTKMFYMTVLLGLGGLYLPGIWLSSRADKRKAAISEAFPDALDMLVVCVEAGLGFDAAFNRVGRQIAPAHPILAEEFAKVGYELRAGKARREAMRNMAHRIGLQEISSFVTLLLQSDALGTSIAQTLRVHADEMRHTRMMRAEEKAHKLPVKMTIPLVSCILPAMIAVVLLPGIITIIRDVIPALGG